MKSNFPEWWDKGLQDWSVDKMFEKLNSLGIKIDKEKFLALTDKYSLLKNWRIQNYIPGFVFLSVIEKKILSGWPLTSYGKN